MTYDDDAKKMHQTNKNTDDDPFQTFLKGEAKREADTESNRLADHDLITRKSKNPPRHLSRVWDFIIPFIVTLVIYFLINYPAQKQQVVLAKFDKLSYALKATVDWQEAINQYCRFSKEKEDTDLLNKLILNFYTSYSTLLSSHADLHSKHYISEQTYEKIHALTAWQNENIARRAQTVCFRDRKSLHSDQYLDNLEKNIETSINNEQNAMRGFRGYFRITWRSWLFIIGIITLMGLCIVLFLKKLRTAVLNQIKSLYSLLKRFVKSPSN